MFIISAPLGGYGMAILNGSAHPAFVYLQTETISGGPIVSVYNSCMLRVHWTWKKNRVSTVLIWLANSMKLIGTLLLLRKIVDLLPPAALGILLSGTDKNFVITMIKGAGNGGTVRRVIMRSTWEIYPLLRRVPLANSARSESFRVLFCWSGHPL